MTLEEGFFYFGCGIGVIAGFFALFPQYSPF